MRIVSCAKLSLVVLWASLPLSARAQDSGAHWVSIGPWGGFVTSLVIDASDPRTLYVTTYNGGVFRSHDRGDSWQPIFTGLGDFSSARVYGLTLDPGDSRTLYAARGSALFRSPDRGDTWAEVAGAAAFGPNSLRCVAFDPERPELMWVGSRGTGIGDLPNGVYESRTRTDCIVVVLVR